MWSNVDVIIYVYTYHNLGVDFTYLLFAKEDPVIIVFCFSVTSNNK